MTQNHLFPMIPEIQTAVISVRGVDEEIGTREEVKLPKEERSGMFSHLSHMVGHLRLTH